MRSIQRVFLSVAALVGIATLLWALPFLTLQAGFTQEVWGSDPGFMGGIAFAPDGDVWVTPCAFGGGSLRRFDAQSTVLVNGTLVHPLIATVASSNTGCGLTNHPNGSLYSNTSSGVTQQDGSTGAPTGGPFGPGGNALGIAVYPLTSELVYVGADGTLFAVDPALTTSRTFSTAVTGFFVDGIFFDPSGRFLFTATRTGGFRISIIDASNGNLIQEVALTSEPDGIAFHASSPKFVVANNTDGTMSRLDFAGDDFTQPAVVSQFASGGFRGDLSQVGADGCLYLAQDGTHFDDGSSSGADSIVRICGGFSPAPGVSSISLTPLSAVNDVGTSHTVTAHVEVDSVPQSGILVTFDVLSGPHTGLNGTDTTDVNGDATFTYTGTSAGIDTLQASFVDGNGVTNVSNSVTKEWVQGACLTFTFDNEDDLVTPLGNGQSLSTPPEFGLLLSINSAGANLGPTTFDSTPGGPNSGTADVDMLVDKGNILMLQDSARPAQSVPGFFDTPLDDPDGGDFIFTFTSPCQPTSVALIDLDPPPNGGASVILNDENGATRTYSVQPGWTGTYGGAPGWKTLDLTTLAPQVGNAPGFRLATASETPRFLSNRVVSMVVHMTGFGAMDDLSVCFAGLARASATTRNGSGVNPLALHSLTQPRVGAIWDTELDCAGHANGLAVLLVFDSPALGSSTPYGELLVGGTRLLRMTRPHAGSSVFFGAPIPNDLALLGLSAHAQGLCSGAPGPQLSNAVDIVAGF